LRLDLGDVFALTEQMNASGPVTDVQRLLAAMADNDIQGIAIGPDGPALTAKGA
jgi:site-specific DNA recombinase